MTDRKQQGEPFDDAALASLYDAAKLAHWATAESCHASGVSADCQTPILRAFGHAVARRALEMAAQGERIVNDDECCVCYRCAAAKRILALADRIGEQADG